jgi:Na+/melibiose symporter-like transporter
MSAFGILSSILALAGVALMGITFYRLNRVTKRFQRLKEEIEDGNEEAHATTQGQRPIP